MGLGGVAIAVPPYVIHPKTAVLGRAGGEWTAYAISRDGYSYQDINGGNPIFNPEEHARIEGGTRDAYITRMHNGKGYIMVTTDMCVRKSHKWTTMVSIS